MLGIRLKPEDENRLADHARSLGKPTSAMAREWIMERLQRESVDEKLRRAARILAAHDREDDYIESDLDD
jgi:predicted DNA-binding protein